jgi:chromosome segregation ATPase
MIEDLLNNRKFINFIKAIMSTTIANHEAIFKDSISEYEKKLKKIEHDMSLLNNHLTQLEEKTINLTGSIGYLKGRLNKLNKQRSKSWFKKFFK